VFLIDGSASLNCACSRHGLTYRVEQHGERNSAERVFREANRIFLQLFEAHADTADRWFRAFAFAWNERI
jgi:transposase-like protein